MYEIWVFEKDTPAGTSKVRIKKTTLNAHNFAFQLQNLYPKTTLSLRCPSSIPDRCMAFAADKAEFVFQRYSIHISQNIAKAE